MAQEISQVSELFHDLFLLMLNPRPVLLYRPNVRLDSIGGIIELVGLEGELVVGAVGG